MMKAVSLGMIIVGSLLVLVAACSSERDMMMVCTMDGRAYMIGHDHAWRVYRIPGADHLCPKKSDQPKSDQPKSDQPKSDQPKSVYKMRST
jgi:hypothetical protein